MKIEKICQKCGKTYSVHPYRSASKFCSISCSNAPGNDKGKGSWKGGKVEVKCPVCGKKQLKYPSQAISPCCSRHCGREWRKSKNRRVVTCTNCGDKYTVHLSRAIRSELQFCSRRCMGEWSTVHFSGVNSANWRGGKSFEPYPITFNNPFKRLIRERDNYTCAICKGYGNCVHHINYVKDDTNPENCVTLCRKCHGKTNSNREYWQSLFISNECE
jgi:endogenous inhibitor of DNA gyrase (YacG/DUF329 family)